MWSAWSHHISFVPLVAAMCILLFACNPNGNEPDDGYLGGANKMLVFSTDSADWYVALFYEGLLYADACTKTLPSPYRLPMTTHMMSGSSLRTGTPSGCRPPA